MKKTIYTILFVFSSLSLFSQTITEFVVNSAEHTTLETAVIAAGLDDELSSEGPFTLFAPTDAAFEALPEGTVEALLQNPTGKLAQILLYHVLDAAVFSTDLSDGQIATTLQGDDIPVTIDGSNVFIYNAQVTMTDIEASNGVVHVLDIVLVPPITSGIVPVSETEIKVGPNPSIDFIQIDLPTEIEGNKKIQLINNNGELIYNQNFIDQILTIDLREIPDGLYHMRLNTDTGVYSDKFIKI